MPFIDSKITVALSDEKKETLKEELGKAISILNKPESFLMLGFEDQYDLYMGGEKLEKGAYVAVSLFGDSTKEAYTKMTGVICDLFEKELQIPKKAVYVTYTGVKDWGWNGTNF